MDSIRIIKEEHRTLAAVLHGLLHVLREVRERGRPADFELLGAMIYYIDVFPERYHHPKEDEYLFRFLRLRHPPSSALLDELTVEHALGAEHMRTLAHALTRFQQGGRPQLPEFAVAVESFVAFEREHMRKEERHVIPMAEKHLTAADWAAVDDAFRGNTDPLVGIDAGIEYRDLFRRIVNIAPPPIGVGPAP
jgi:hemerythrin-like domain-containing protein